MTYIIAEIGNNHNGSLEKAKKLVLGAAETGADAIKTQSFRGLDIVAPYVLSSDYPDWDAGGYEYWYEFAESVALKLEDHQELINYTNDLGLHFITTPVSPDIVSFLEGLSGITAYKIASMDLNNLSLLEALAATGKPIIMSTGMGSLDEVLTAVSYFEESRLSILHCVSEYPLDPKNAGLNNIRHLQEKFQRARIGFSDHSLSHELTLSAIGLGATVIEKHITLDREDPAAAEHHMSMEVNEFKTMVDWIRSIDASRSSNEWSRSAIEKEGRKGNRRSFHYKRDMKAGTTVTLNDLVFVRPEFGIDYGELDTILDKQLLLDKESYAPCLKEDFGY